MILKKRERILVLVIVSLLMVVVLQQAYSKLHGSHGRLKTQRTNAAAELERMNTRLKNAEMASQRLHKWQQRSLPSDTHTAQSLYQNWLFQLADDPEFSDINIEALPGRRRGDVCYALKFTFNAKTTLDGLTKFLHRFYSADHLHQIFSLTVTPKGKGKPLDVRMTIEALSLSDAKFKDELSTAASQRKLAALADYVDKIGGRNLFAAYQPPAPPSKTPPPKDPKPKPKPQSDQIKSTELTGVTSTGDRLQAWILVKTTGDHHELHEGDTFDIDGTKCKVLRIGPRYAEIEIDGKRFRVSLGQNLSEAEDLSESK